MRVIATLSTLYISLNNPIDCFTYVSETAYYESAGSGDSATCTAATVTAAAETSTTCQTDEVCLT